MSTITKSVPVKLNAEEYRQRAQRYQGIDREIAAIDKAKAKATSEFAAKKKALEAEKETLARVVELGEEERPVECREERNAERGIIEFVRVDNGEIAGSRPMSAHEKQLTIPGSEHTATVVEEGPPMGIDPDGLFHQLSETERDTVRRALERGEEYVDVPLEGKGDVRIVAIKGLTIKKQKLTRVRRRSKKDAAAAEQPAGEATSESASADAGEESSDESADGPADPDAGEDPEAN